jgi:hypothetical protein
MEIDGGVGGTAWVALDECTDDREQSRADQNSDPAMAMDGCEGTQPAVLPPQQRPSTRPASLFPRTTGASPPLQAARHGSLARPRPLFHLNLMPPRPHRSSLVTISCTVIGNVFLSPSVSPFFQISASFCRQYTCM